MKKLLSIATASILIVSCFAGCGSTESGNSEVSGSKAESSASDSEETADETEEVTEEIEEETTEEVSEEESSETTEKSSDIEEITEPETLPTPEFNPDTVTETDFYGNWECSKMFTSGQYVEGNFLGIPLGVFAQVVINDDKTGKFGSGIEGGEDSWASFTWELSDNVIKLTLDDPVDEENTIIYIQDGEMILSNENATELVYFTKVDELSYMTEDELMRAMDIGTDDIISEDGGSTVSEESDVEETTEIVSDGE